MDNGGHVLAVAQTLATNRMIACVVSDIDALRLAARAPRTEKQYFKDFCLYTADRLVPVPCMNGASPPRWIPEVVRVSPFPLTMVTTVLFRLHDHTDFDTI